jgi:hypothetical protein
VAYLITAQEALAKISQFEDCSLPKEDWTHEMHLLVALNVVLTHGQNAWPVMKDRIWRYNEVIGKGNVNTGYHATLTVFWLWAVRDFALRNDFKQFDDEAIDQMLFDEQLTQRKFVEDYYDYFVLTSPAARREYRPANFMDMDGVEWFLADS